MEISQRLFSNDGKTVKYLQKLNEGFVIETTYVDYFNKHIICFSSQVGCAVGCLFCVTGLRSKDERYRRSLNIDELMKQCFNVISDRELGRDKKPILFSCMGEGEPFLNFKNVVSVLGHFGLHVPNARLAVSTSGVKPSLIRSLAHIDFPAPFKLQVSLHGPNDFIRGRLIPLTRPVKEIVDAVRFYYWYCGRPVDWNYLLFDGVNDSEECALELAELLGSGWNVKFNVFNPISESPLKQSNNSRLVIFRKIIEDRGLTTEYYETNGADITAACGQLTYSRA